MSAKDAVAAYGERVAAQHLEEDGFVVLERNWRCSDGELDIVALEGQTLVFCEVKTRRSDRYGTPAEALIASKVRRLRRLAARWLRERTRLEAGELSGLFPDAPSAVRFDVVSVWPQPSGRAIVDHLRGAF